MVAGSRLSISSVSNAPFAPALCSADAMNQFVEYSLSPPRGEDCWMPDTNATPINMAFQLPTCVISMGIGYDAGFADVPEARPIRNMPGAFISAMLCWPWAARGPMAHIATLTIQLRRSFFSQNMTLLTPHKAADTLPSRAQRTPRKGAVRSEAHTSELHSPCNLVCRLLLENTKDGLMISLESARGFLPPAQVTGGLSV